jgi:alpha-beta hydrolase superfamily lysophospholipase
MNMHNYPMDVWVLHRKIHHRFIKHKDYILKATLTLRAYQDAIMRNENAATESAATTAESAPAARSSAPTVVYLLSSSDTEDDTEEECVSTV